MAAGIPDEPLGHRLLALEPARRGDPLLREHESLLRAGGRSLAEQAAQSQVEDRVVAATAVGLVTGRLPGAQQLGPGEAPATQRLQRHRLGPVEHGLAEPELLAAAGRLAPDPLRGEPEHPAEILGRHDEERAAHRPAAHDRARVVGVADVLEPAGRGAQGDRHRRAGVVLALGAGQVPHHLGGRGQRVDQPLREQPHPGHVGQGPAVGPHDPVPGGCPASPPTGPSSGLSHVSSALAPVAPEPACPAASAAACAARASHAGGSP